MKRLVAVALGAIALLGAAAFAFIAYMTRAPAPSAAPVAAPQPDVAVVAPPAPPAPVPVPAGAAEHVLGRPPSVAMLPPPAPEPAAAPPPGSWEAVNPVGRPSELGPIGPPVMLALREATPRLTACFDETQEARFASRGDLPSVSRDRGTGAIGGPAVLMLQLEATHGAVRIVDAPVESQGSAGDGVVLCAQNVLRGMRIEAPQARPGARYRLPHALPR